jgi:hypothetical protein
MKVWIVRKKGENDCHGLDVKVAEGVIFVLSLSVIKMYMPWRVIFAFGSG